MVENLAVTSGTFKKLSRNDINEKRYSMNLEERLHTCYCPRQASKSFFLNMTKHKIQVYGIKSTQCAINEAPYLSAYV